MNTNENKDGRSPHQAENSQPPLAEKKPPRWLTIPLNVTIATAAVAFTVGSGVIVATSRPEIMTGVSVIRQPVLAVPVPLKPEPIPDAPIGVEADPGLDGLHEPDGSGM